MYVWSCGVVVLYICIVIEFCVCVCVDLWSC